MRIYVPPGEVQDDEEADEKVTPAQAFKNEIVDRADIGINSAENIATFDDLLFMVPRGRYRIEMFPEFLKLQGKTFAYRISYSSITKLFLFQKPGGTQYVFVVS